MSYQHSLNMFTRSNNALSSSMAALDAEFTLSPFYDFGHFAAMAISFFTHIYNVIANLFLALSSLPITFYSIFADDSSINALGRGVASIFTHTLAALSYVVNLVITPVSVVLRTLVSIFMDSKHFYGEYEEKAAVEVDAALKMSFSGDVQDDNSIADFVASLDL